MGVITKTRKRDGSLIYFVDGKAKDGLKILLGHLINPQVCGLSYNEAVDMTLTEATAAIEAVGLSNQILAKAAKDG